MNTQDNKNYPIGTCIKCGKDATYIVPEHLCTEHWAEWWVDGDRLDGELSYEDRITQYLECYDVIRKSFTMNEHPSGLPWENYPNDPPWVAECRTRRLAGERAFRIRALNGLLLAAFILALFAFNVFAVLR